MIKTETLLLLAGAVGVGYLLSKRKGATAVATELVGSAAPRVATITIGEPVGTAVAIVPTVGEPYPVYLNDGDYGPSWGPSWGTLARGRGRGGRHGRGHGGHGRRR